MLLKTYIRKGVAVMNEIVIKTERLTRKYQNKTAIDDLTMNIHEGGITGLVGQNGSGKTTLMKMCAGLLDKTSGGLEVLNGSPLDNLQVISNIVYTYHNLKFEKQLKLGAILHNYNTLFSTFDMDFAKKLLKYFDLKENMKYNQLSQGMASIFNFICGLSCRAPLTMFDEPVLGMDIAVRKAAYEILLRDYTEYPRTIIISSHMLSEIEGVLSDILLIHNGKLVLHDNIDELRQSAYMLEGDLKQLELYCSNKKTIYRYNGETGAKAVVYETADAEAVQLAETAGLRFSTVRPEDLCMYLTRENKEGELECLWKKAN